MSEIHLHKADPILSSKKIEDVRINIKDSLPKNLSLDEAKSLYQFEANVLFDRLKNSLPQGTRYQLLLLMLNDSPIFYKGK